MIEIERHATLARVQVEERDAEFRIRTIADEGRLGPQCAAAARLLDQDHIRTHIGEKLAAVVRETLRQVDHIEPRKCALLAHQSTFAPERLTTGAHLRISLWINFPNPTGATRTILFDCRIMGEDLSDSLPRFQNAKPSQNMRAVMNARDPSPV